MNIDVQDDEAFLRCQTLLDEQYTAQQDNFAKLRRKIKVSLQSAQQHIQICEAEKKERIQQIQKLKGEIADLEGEQSNFGKRVKRRHELREKVQEYLKEIEASSVRLQGAKEKSYQQKGLYLQTQELELNLVEQLQRLEDEEKAYYQFRGREERYRQLSRIVQKLHMKTEGGSHEVEGYLKERIGAMAHLRTSILSIEDKLQEYNTSLQQQLFVMEGLRRRAEQERGPDDELFNKYRNKYQQLYFSKQNDLGNWKNYKAYLEELLKRDRVEPHLRQPSQSRSRIHSFSPSQGPHATFSAHRHHSSLARTPLTRSEYRRKQSNLRTEPTLGDIQEEEEERALQYPNRSPRTPVYSVSRVRPQRIQLTQQSVRLPKLGRVSQNYGQSGKIKDNVKKMINESDVSLQSVNSEQALSGEFIEVQFHKK